MWRNANRPRQPVRDVRIDYSKRWQHQLGARWSLRTRDRPILISTPNISSLSTAGSTDFWPITTAELLELLCSLTHVPMPDFSESYVDAAAGDLDLRPKRKKEGPAFIAETYVQVFSDRMPFQPNLSVADLLFAEGPAAASVLARCRL